MTTWLVRGALLVLLAFTNLNDLWSPDVVPNALFSWTVLREGNVDYDEFATAVGVAEPVTPTVGVAGADAPAAGLIDRGTYFFRACGAPRAAPGPDSQPAFPPGTSSPPPQPGTGSPPPPRTAGGPPPRSAGGPPPPGPADHVCSVFPPGIALVALPFFAPFVLAGAPATDLALLLGVGHLVAALVEAAATLVLWSILRRFAGARWAFALALLYVLGTSVRTVASQALWQHAGVHLALALALAQVLRPGPLAEWRALLAGLALGVGSAVRQTVVLVVPALLRDHPWRVIAGAALGVVPLLAYDLAAFGTPFEQGYGSKPFDLASIPTALAGLLVSPSRGLFVYEPWSVAGIAALVLAWRRPGVIAARLRWLSLSALATLLLYASYAEWWGGRVFGPRFLDDLAPLLVAALAWGIGEGLLGTGLRRIAFAVAAAWSLLLFQAAAFVYDQRWDTEPLNVNLSPQRLWDWSDPQWLAVLRDVPSHGGRVAGAVLLTALVVAALARVEQISSRS